MSDPIMVLDASGSGAPPVTRPMTPAEQAAKDAVAAEEAARITYARSTNVAAPATTTDATPLEVFRFPCEQQRMYEARLVIRGVDRGSWVVKRMVGEFCWKRPATGNAAVVGLTVVADAHDAAATGWAPNFHVETTDIVFTVAGAAGRTVDWWLDGQVATFSPGGL